jgi:hypothetical protein
MFKQLLYLYNDGHIPFQTGRGGLGYHLPQYPKVIHGTGKSHRGFDNSDDEEEQPDIDIMDEVETNDVATNLSREIKDMIEELDEIERSRTKLNKKDDTLDLKEVPEMIEKVQALLKKPKSKPEPVSVPEPEPEKNDEDKVIEKNVLKKIKNAIENYKDIYNKELTSEQIDILKNEILKEKMSNKKDKFKNVNYGDIEYYLKEKNITPEDSQYIKEVREKQRLQNEERQKIEHEKRERKEYVLSLNDKLHDPNVPLSEKQSILDNEDDLIDLKILVIDKFNKDFREKYAHLNLSDTEMNTLLGGKGLEYFLTTTAKPLIETINDDLNIDVVKDLGDNPIIPKDDNDPRESKQTFCFIDNISYNSTTKKGVLNEIKDFKIDFTNEYDLPTWKDYIPIQISKLIGTSYMGNSVYDLWFHMVGDKYIPYKVTYHGKSLTQDIKLEKYNLISTASDGKIMYCNILDLINNSMYNQSNTIEMRPYQLKNKTIYRCTIPNPHKDKLYGKSKEESSLRIPKSMFKEWKYN